MVAIQLFLCSCWIFAANASCNLYATIFRQLRKEGFHLHVYSKIEIVVTGSSGCPAWDACTLALAESIPSSFYVKESEISIEGITGCSTEIFDVEETELKSRATDIYQYLPFQLSLNLIQAQATLPIHIRYHSPGLKGGFVSAILEQPKLLLLCKDAEIPSTLLKAPCPICSTKNNCSWIDVPYKTNSAKFTVDVPIGNLDDLLIVRVFTYFIAFGGCAYLCLVILNTVRHQSKLN